MLPAAAVRQIKNPPNFALTPVGANPPNFPAIWYELPLPQVLVLSF